MDKGKYKNIQIDQQNSERIEELEKLNLHLKEVNNRLFYDLTAAEEKEKKHQLEIKFFDKQILENQPLQKNLETAYKKQKELENEIANLRKKIIDQEELNNNLRDKEKKNEEEKGRFESEILKIHEISNKKQKDLETEISDLKKRLSDQDFKLKEFEASLSVNTKSKEEFQKSDNSSGDVKGLKNETGDQSINLLEISYLKADIIASSNRHFREKKMFIEEKEELIKIIEDLKKQLLKNNDFKVETLIEINENIIEKNEALRLENKKSQSELQELRAFKEKIDNQEKKEEIKENIEEKKDEQGPPMKECISEEFIEGNIV